MAAESPSEQNTQPGVISVAELLDYLNDETGVINGAEGDLVSVRERSPQTAETSAFSYKLGKVEGQKDAVRGVLAWLEARGIASVEPPLDY